MAQLDMRNPDNWLPRDLFAAYCGDKSEKLLAYYDKAKAKKKALVFSLDWLALLILPAWLGYRRQWTLWTTLVVTIAVMSIIAGIARVELPGGAFGGALLTLGLMAQGLLLTTANTQYAKLKQQGLSEDAIRTALANRASPSVGLAVAGLAGALAINTVIVLLLPE